MFENGKWKSSRPFSNRRRKLFEHYFKSNFYIFEAKMQISSSNQSSSNQGGTRPTSSNEQKEGRDATNVKVPQSSRDKDSDDDSVASVDSVHSVASTESQKSRRIVQAGSPSKRAVELVTVQGSFAEVIHDLDILEKMSFCLLLKTPRWRIAKTLFLGNGSLRISR